jgi:hypothetical protein
MDWRREATVSVYPQEDDEPGGAWWDQEGAALETAVADDGLKLTILRATGLLVDLSRVRNIYGALNARSADYEVFSPMFEGPGSPELAGELREELASCSSQVVLVDRVWLAPAWRGHGAGRLLGWVCPDPMVVTLMPSPIALDEEQQGGGRGRLQPGDGEGPPDLEVRRLPALRKDIMVMDPALVHHGEAVDKLGLPQ